MKKLAIISILLLSCATKDPYPRFCWSCNMLVYEGGKQTSSYEQVCNTTEAEIRSYEERETVIGDGFHKLLICTK